MMQHNDLILKLLKNIPATATEKALANGFSEGRAYRVNLQRTIPQGGNPVYLKYVNTGDTVLTLSQLELDSGGVMYEVFTESEITENVVSTTPVTVYPKNTMSTNPRLATASQVTVTRGGQFDVTGEANTTLAIRTPAQGGAISSVTTGEDTPRGFGATTLYVKISPLAGVNTDTRFTLKQEWVDL